MAAVGDLHVGADTPETLHLAFDGVVEHADVLLLAGDLTHHGLPDEGRLLSEALARVQVPMAAVLGNHDYHHGSETAIRASLEQAGVRVLEGECAIFDLPSGRLGVAGVKGFGGGFAGACGSEFGEPEMKAFIRHTKETAQRLRQQLVQLPCEVRIALTHYAPINGTLMGERLEIFPFLGSYLLGEAIDSSACTLALHGHAHRGTERGVTIGGVPVRNVARPVIRAVYKVYSLPRSGGAPPRDTPLG